jgi:hypothetical protein
MDFVLGRVIPLAVYGGMFGYPVLQYLAIYWTSGRWQVLASLPLVPMAILLAVAALSGSGPANTWSLLLVLAAPLALVYLAILLTVHRRARVGVLSAPKQGGRP